MSRSRGNWVVLALAAAVVAVTLVQRVRMQEVRALADLRKDELGRLDGLRQENERLRRQVAERTAFDERALEEARVEAARAQRRTTARTVSGASGEATSVERFTRGSVVPAAEWKNVGRSTAERALETSLWAAAGGDVEALAGSITFMDTATRSAAQALLETLPAAERERYRTPEQLIAALTIPDVPNGAVEVQQWNTSEPAGEWRSARLWLSSSDGTGRNVLLNFHRELDEWKVVATDRVVAKYASQFKAGRPLAEMLVR